MIKLLGESKAISQQLPCLVLQGLLPPELDDTELTEFVCVELHQSLQSDVLFAKVCHYSCTGAGVHHACPPVLDHAQISLHSSARTHPFPHNIHLRRVCDSPRFLPARPAAAGDRQGKRAGGASLPGRRQREPPPPRAG